MMHTKRINNNERNNSIQSIMKYKLNLFLQSKLKSIKATNIFRDIPLNHRLSIIQTIHNQSWIELIFHLNKNILLPQKRISILLLPTLTHRVREKHLIANPIRLKNLKALNLSKHQTAKIKSKKLKTLVNPPIKINAPLKQQNRTWETRKTIQNNLLDQLSLRRIYLEHFDLLRRVFRVCLDRDDSRHEA